MDTGGCFLPPSPLPSLPPSPPHPTHHRAILYSSPSFSIPVLSASQIPRPLFGKTSLFFTSSSLGTPFKLSLYSLPTPPPVRSGRGEILPPSRGLGKNSRMPPRSLKHFSFWVPLAMYTTIISCSCVYFLCYHLHCVPKICMLKSQPPCFKM